MGVPVLLVVAGIAWVRRSTGRPFISRIPALRSYHVLVLLGMPSIFSTFMSLNARGPFLHAAPIYLFCALSWLAAITGMIKGLHIYRQVRNARGLACLRCLYPLAHDSHRCPECGLEYTSADVRQEWRSERVPFDIG